MSEYFVIKVDADLLGFEGMYHFNPSDSTVCLVVEEICIEQTSAIKTHKHTHTQ